MTTDRLDQARQSGRSEKDLQLLIAQDARQRGERSEAEDGFEEKLARLKAQRLARDAAGKDTVEGKGKSIGKGIGKTGSAGKAKPKGQAKPKGRA